jgi:predicted nucleic acid-binding protein
MGVVIDTGVFIRWERDGGAVDLSRWTSFGEPCISVITESELKVGIHRANTEERREKRLLFVTAVLSNVAILPVDSRIADVHASLVATLSKLGTTIGPHDTWIAATPLRFGNPLLTTNVAEFSRVPQLRVLDYARNSGS